mgnify:CR=1 FL=1
MKYGSLILEKKEFVTLKRLLNLSGNYKDASRKNSVLRLQNELESAIVSNEDEMPDDVIRFNSEVTIVSSDGWENSVLTPMGLAVMGYAKGDVIDWEFPGGAKSLKVTEVKQIKTKSNQIQL